MKLFGKELKFNNNKVYHAGDKPVAADIKFTDGKTFQQKLDDGSLRGPQGPQGVKGDTGAQGPTGATGATGAAGVTPTIKAGTVTTGNAGTNASVTASTSGTTTTFNFTIPRGATGATGNTGPQGPQGIQGIQGPKGDTGATGAKGATGSTGAKGVSMRLKGAWSSTTAYVNDSNYIDLVTSGGNTYACKASNTNQAVTNTTYWELIAQKGNTGATGPQGPQGIAGPTGATGAKGATGPQGPKGDTGLQGAKGDTGPAGATPTIKAGTVTTGAAGTNAAVTASTSGTTTTFNFTIPRGATGTTGATGPQGPKGDTGSAGKDGATPHIGSNGNWYIGSTDLGKPSRGATGPQGPKGDTGLQGPQGAKGADGLTTSVTVGSTKYTHSNGNITIPAYPTLSSLGAASSSHNHDSVYLRLSGGALTGNTSIDTSKYFQYKLTKGAVTTETGTIAQNTAVNMLGYSEGNNLHLGNGIWDNSITQGTTYVSGAAGLTLRTVNGTINFISDKTSVGYVTTFGVVLGTNEAISSVSTGYKAYDIYRKCNSSLTGYSHTNARFGLVDADSGVAALETKLFNTSGTTIRTAYFRLDANAGRAYTDGYFQSGQKWMKLGTRWLTIDTAAPSGAKGDIWIQCY